jgi:hypothetical protein
MAAFDDRSGECYFHASLRRYQAAGLIQTIASYETPCCPIRNVVVDLFPASKRIPEPDEPDGYTSEEAAYDGACRTCCGGRRIHRVGATTRG